MTTENKNVKFSNRLSDWDNAKWQLIFKTDAGLDYCREPYEIAAYPTKEAILNHAAFLLTTNRNVSSVVIERW